MGSLTIGYAGWTDTLTITGTVTTASWERCETAYAYGGSLATPFTELLGQGPWGWSNGPLSDEVGSYTFDIYAGAGGGDINNGTLVGTLTVDYDGTTVTVTYDMDEGYTMKSTHLYVDTESLPINHNGESTTAPGQYPYKHDDLNNVTTDFYLVNGFGGEDIHVVAHAVVCWFSISPP
jgi:hypothetical protein